MSKSNLDIVDLIGNTILSTCRLINKLLPRKRRPNLRKTIDLIWQRGSVGVWKKESLGHNRKPEMLHPEFIRQEKKGKNDILYYRLPVGMSYKDITKHLHLIESYFKSEVMSKILENDNTAHFSLTILSGRLRDYILANIQGIVTEIHEKADGLWVPIGYSRRGLELVNLANDNSPHILIGGSIGGGKSTLLRLIMILLHVVYPLKFVELWLMDMKQGNEINTLGKKPSLVTRKITDPSEALALFTDLFEENIRRYKLFQEYDIVTNITDYNSIAPNSIPHIILVIDEIGKLEGKEYAPARLLLKHIAGDGRASGIHIIVSCHRPTANIIDGTLKNNLPVAVCFRANPVSARVILGEDEWEASQLIDSDIAGRAVFAYDKQVLIQVPWVSPEQTKAIMKNYQLKDPIMELKTGKIPIQTA